MKRKIFSLALATSIALGSFASLADSEVIINKPFINGYKEETSIVKPDAEIKRCEIAKIVTEAYEIAKADNKFPDVDKDHWAKEFIGGLQKAEVVEGDPDGNFRPEDALTRAEFSAIVLRATKGLKFDGEEVEFKDTEGHWGKETIAKLSKANVVEGYGDGIFAPEKKVTRGEAITMVLRALGRNIDEKIADKVENPFTDIAEEHWAYKNVLGASTEYSYRILEDGKEEIVVEADSKDITSVTLPNQAFTKYGKNRILSFRTNNSTESADLAAIKANGYNVNFIQLNDKGEEESGNEVESIFTDDTDEDGNNIYSSETGKIKDDKEIKNDKEIKKEDVKVKIVITQILENGKEKFIASSIGTVSFYQEIAQKTEAIKEIELVLSNDKKDYKGTVINGNKLVAGETVDITKFIVDIDDKKDIDVLSEDVEYSISSSNSDILSVENTKELHAKTVGKATITVKIGKITKDIEMEVVSEKRKPVSMKEGLNLNLVKSGLARTIDLEIKDQYGETLKNIKDENLEFNLTSGTSVEAEYKSETGLLEVEPGDKEEELNIYVSAKTGDAKEQIGTVKVVVGEPKGDTSYQIQKKDGSTDLKLDLNKENDEIELQLVEVDENKLPIKTVSGVEYSIDDENIASVTEEGKVKPINPGKTTIRAKYDKKTYTAELEVVGSKTKLVSATFESPELNKAKEYKLSDFIKVENIKTDKNTVSNPTIENGIIKIKEEEVGNITIYITAYKSKDTDDEVMEMVNQIEEVKAENIKLDGVIIDTNKPYNNEAVPFEAKKADLRIIVKDKSGKTVADKTFNIDASNK